LLINFHVFIYVFILFSSPASLLTVYWNWSWFFKLSQFLFVNIFVPIYNSSTYLVVISLLTMHKYSNCEVVSFNIRMKSTAEVNFFQFKFLNVSNICFRWLIVLKIDDSWVTWRAVNCDLSVCCIIIMSWWMSRITWSLLFIISY